MSESSIYQLLADGNTQLAIKQITEHPAQLTKVDEDGRNALQWAVSLGNTEAVAAILRAGQKLSSFDIDAADEAGWTALHIAAAVGKLEILDQLLANTPPPSLNAKTNSGQTPLFMAVSKRHGDAVDKLLAAGASASVKDANGNTALQRAAAGGSASLVEKLLAAKAPVNASDSAGWTALHHAEAEGHPSIAKILLAKGADPERTTKDGETPAQLRPKTA